MKSQPIRLTDTSPHYPGQNVYVLDIQVGEEFDMCVSPRKDPYSSADAQWIRSQVDVLGVSTSDSLAKSPHLERSRPKRVAPEQAIEKRQPVEATAPRTEIPAPPPVPDLTLPESEPITTATPKVAPSTPLHYQAVNRNDLAKSIRGLRKRLHWTQKQAATLAGLSDATVSVAERGYSAVAVSSVLRLQQLLADEVARAEKNHELVDHAAERLHLSKSIKLLRSQLNWTKKAVADEACCSIGLVAIAESETGTASLKIVQTIEQKLKLALEQGRATPTLATKHWHEVASSPVVSALEITSETTFKDYVLYWLGSKEGLVQDVTLSNYSGTIFRYLIPHLGHLRLEQITEWIVQELITGLSRTGSIKTGGGLSRKSLRGMGMLLKMILKDASRMKLVNLRNIEINYPRTDSEQKVQVLSREDQQKLIQECLFDGSPRAVGILLTLSTGMRIGELAGLIWEDVDYESRTLHVQRTLQRTLTPRHRRTSETLKTYIHIGAPKTKASNRKIPISDMALRSLKNIDPGNPAAYILTGTEHILEPRTYRIYWANMLRKLDIPYLKFHGLRHTFATRLIENGANVKTVSQILGHTTVNMTLNTYTHPDEGQQRSAVELLNVFQPLAGRPERFNRGALPRPPRVERHQRPSILRQHGKRGRAEKSAPTLFL